jgi:VIT family
MATGAFLASRSEAEVVAANVAQERREIAEHPEEEKEELSLFYQLKGLDEAFANQLAEKLAEDPDSMLKVLATEELGGTEAGGDPVQSAVAAGISTFLGAMVPSDPIFLSAGQHRSAGGCDRLAHRPFPGRRGQVAVHAAHVVGRGSGDDGGRRHRRGRDLRVGFGAQGLRLIRREPRNIPGGVRY